MTTREKLQDVALGAAAVILAAVMLLGCAGAPGDKVRSALDAMRDGFIARDLDHQRELVDASEPGAPTDLALATYRQKRDGVIAAFAEAYEALAELLEKPSEASGQEFVRRVTVLGNKLSVLQDLKPSVTPRPRAAPPEPIAP